jgi:hypothetical protein
MEEYSLDAKILEKINSNSFDSLFDGLKLQSDDKVKFILFSTAKLAYWRENRLHRQLSTKDLAFLLKTAHFHFNKKTEFSSTKEQSLLDKNITEEEAQLYFIDCMSAKKFFDVFRREISIPDSSLDCCYKDEVSGKHKICSEYYRIYRARRLPWVIPTLKQSEEIYELDKPQMKCREYFYISSFNIPYTDLEDNAAEKYHKNYFVVLARRKYDKKELEFITEFPMFDYFDLLQYIERWRPYEGK